MTTGLRAKTAAWLKANPYTKPIPGGFGWNYTSPNKLPTCSWFIPYPECCILGAVGHALGVAETDPEGGVSIAGSRGPVKEEVANVLGLPHGLAVAIAKDFDDLFEKGPLTWEAGLALLPE